MRAARWPSLPGALALAAVALTPAPARAIERSRLVFGAEIGGGWISCGEECDTAGGLAAGFHAGWMLGDRAALMLDGATIAHPGTLDTPQLTSSIGGVGLRLFVGQRAWLQATVGKGALDRPFEAFARAVGIDDTAAAISGALGIEVFQGGSFAAALSARIGTFAPERGRVTNLSVQLDLTLY